MSEDALDAYSRTVTAVVEAVLPSVASLSVRGGGVLADGAGRAVGVNTAVAGIGIGLAVPINDGTRSILDTLVATGRVRRAWLGIVGAEVPLAPPLAARVGAARGLQVADLAPGSPAALAGLHRGDVVVEIAGERAVTTTAVQRRMVEGAIGRPMEITVWRNGALVDVIAVPTELAGV